MRQVMLMQRKLAMTIDNQQQQGDIRNYFSRQAKRHTNSDDSSKVAKELLIESPLIAKSIDVAVDEGLLANLEACLDISHYMNIVNLQPVIWQEKEQLELQILLSTAQIELKFREELNALECHLIRKILHDELQRASSPSSTMINDGHNNNNWSWIHSEPFIDGIKSLVMLLTSGSTISNLSAQAAWDLLMVIEPALKAEPLLSLDKRLFPLVRDQERIILQHTLWQSQAPVYILLEKEGSAVKRPRSRRQSLSSPGKALNSLTFHHFSHHHHPLRDNNNSMEAVTGLEFFFRKFLRSAAMTIEKTIIDLELSAKVRQATWSLFVEALDDELELRLLDKRHLLTIVASTIYSVCKLFDENRSFSQIIQSLSKQHPSYTDDWYMQVRLACDNENVDSVSIGDLVTFYNNTYLNLMRGRIYELSEPQTPRKTTSLLFPPPMTSRVPVAKNITLNVSPATCKTLSTGSPTCISMLGNLGVKRSGATPPPPPGSPTKIARKLRF